MASPDRIRNVQVLAETLPMPCCAPTRNTMIHEKISTIMVRIAVAVLESVFLIPHFASMEVSPANRADPNANRIHICNETQGVCQVENIVSLSASRRERKIPYYVLRPVFDKSRVSYIPVENHQVKLRELFTREEAEALQGTEEMKKDEKLRQAVEYVLGKKEG